MKKDFSPEEKLLRLIKGSKKKRHWEEEGGREGHSSLSPHGLPAGTLSNGISKIPGSAGGGNAPHRLQDKAGSKGRRTFSAALPLRLFSFNTRTLNYVLIVTLVVLLAYFAFDIAYTSYATKEPKLLREVENVPAVEEKDVLKIEPYSYYSSAIKGRNIFMPPQVETEAVITGPSVEEVSANLSLIGIIAGDRPQAIIESKKTGKSYFLYKGGSVDKAKVVDILEDSVIMEYQGERFELVL